jgi:hypothetical protein
MCSNTIVKLLAAGIVCWASLPTTASQSQWGHYPINKDDFHDFSGNNRHGTALDGAVTVFDPLRGWVADFTLNAQGSPRIQLPADDPAASDELSISARVRWFGPDGRWQGIAGKSLNATNRGWILQLGDADGEVHWPDGPTGVILDRDRWLHLAVTFGQGTSRVYVDGRKKYEASGVSLPRSGNWAAAHVTLGHAEDRTDASLWFNGYLDDVYLFSKALSSGEVTDLFNGIVPSFLKARNPSPADGAAGVTFPVLLSWTPGDTAFTHKVYIGTGCNLGDPELHGVVPESKFFWQPLTPGPDSTFCWCIDEVEKDGTVHTGDVWCFSTQPATAPGRGVMNPCCDPVLTWPPVSEAVAYHVYFDDSVAEVAQGSPVADQGTTTQTTLRLGTLHGGTTYYWRVDVISANGEVYAGAVWSFTAPLCTGGGVLREWWLNVPWVSLEDLLRSPCFQQIPDGRECLDCFEGPTNWRDHYCSRLSALLLPPISGDYTFYIASDEQAALFLSTDANPANRILIAGVPSATGRRDWDRFSEQKSEPVKLMAGKKYYMEALMRENTGNDHIAVAWRRLGMLVPEVICTPFVQNAACRPYIAHSPNPQDGEAGVALTPILSWTAGREAVQHDVYFGDDYDLVANASPVRCGPYAGRQSQTTYDPGPLAPGKTYYWRVDEINPANPASPWTGCVWSFTTAADCAVVIDNFESYTDSNPISSRWSGTPYPVEIERTVVHGGQQSMRMNYDNVVLLSCSEARLVAPPEANWSVQGTSALSLWFHGGPPKFMETSPNDYVMSASGTDIGGTADEFRYACRQLNGDGIITARVQWLGNTNSQAEAGVMIRETLDPGSRHAMVVVTPGNDISFQRRLTTSGPSEDTTQPGVQAPYWVRLTRQGNTFTAQHSSGGTTWTNFVGGPTSVTIAMPASVYVGLALTSHNPDAVAVARFSEVSTAGPWQVADVGVVQPGNDPSPLYVRVLDSAGNVAIVPHPDNPYAVLIDDWQQWCIPLSAFTGVNLARLKEVAIGVCDMANPSPTGAGRIYIDDICLQ